MNSSEVESILSIYPSARDWPAGLIHQIKLVSGRLNVELLTSLIKRISTLTPDERDKLNVSSELYSPTLTADSQASLERRLARVEQLLDGIVEAMSARSPPIIRALGSLKFGGSDQARRETISTFKDMSQFTNCFAKWWSLVPEASKSQASSSNIANLIIESVVMACCDFASKEPPSSLKLTSTGDRIKVSNYNDTLELNVPSNMFRGFGSSLQEALHNMSKSSLHDALTSLRPLIVAICNEVAGREIIEAIREY